METKQTIKHTYDMWYMQNRLEADYGKFECNKCGETFYHSPSTIYYGEQEKYNCCCGHCTNKIIYNDWGENPYK